MVLDSRIDNPEVGMAIEMTTLCRGLNVLPYEGGLYQQPWIVVEMMKIVIEMQNKKEEQERKKQRAAKHS